MKRLLRQVAFPVQKPIQQARAFTSRSFPVPRDRILKTFTNNLSVSLISNANSVQVAKEKHNLRNKDLVELLGKAMSGVCLQASFLKGEERIKLHFQGTGAVQDIIVEAMKVGEVRGFIETSPEIESYEKMELSDGILKVSKVLYNVARPVTSTVSLARGDITSDLGRYWKLVEQLPSVISLQTFYDTASERVLASGGFLIHSFPETPKSLITQLGDHLRTIPTVGLMLQRKSLEEILKEILPASEIDSLPPREDMSSVPIGFFCRHSRERILRTVAALSPDEFSSLDLEHNPIKCNYCAQEIVIPPEEVQQVRQETLSREEQVVG